MSLSKILFYGDSNTYGYDPRGFLGMRYPEEARWTTKVRQALAGKFEIMEEGMNGRCLPTLPREASALDYMTRELASEDTLVMMLGTNDILLTAYPDADEAVEKLERFLDWANTNPFKIIIIAPVLIANTPDLAEYHAASLQLNQGYRKVCKERGITCIDAGEWEIDLTYDGVHFSEEGHRQFAAKLLQNLEMSED